MVSGQSEQQPPGPPEGRWLGVDAGEARVGLAMSDPAGRLAMPLDTLERRGLDDQAVARQIADLVSAHNVVQVVVGLPVSLSGQEGPAAARARELVAALRTALPEGLHLHTQDERHSTTQAHRQLREAGRPTKRHRAVVDQAAAVVILQAALDHKLVKCSPSNGEGGELDHGSVGSVQ